VTGLERLLELAGKASLGPWVEDDGNIFSKPQSDIEWKARRPDGTGSDMWDGLVAKCEQTLPNFDADAAFIAAANPAVVKALVEALQAASVLRENDRDGKWLHLWDDFDASMARLETALKGGANG
jgi:hypothetical protein